MKPSPTARTDGPGLTVGDGLFFHLLMRNQIKRKAARPPSAPPTAPPIMAPLFDDFGAGDGVALVVVFDTGVAVEVVSVDDLELVDVGTAVRGTGPTYRGIPP
jgi:hypothetical protein